MIHPESEGALAKKNIFVMALDPFNLELLQTIRDAEDYNFHSLLDYHDLIRSERYPMDRLLEKGREQLRTFPETIDAIVDYWDFPATTMLPILRREFGFPMPSFEAVLKCEHKYWSRLQQTQTAPDLVPQFQLFDPFAEDPLKRIDLPFPFWVKPVKAHSSFLGFRIENDEDFRRCLDIIRRRIARVAEPFNDLLRLAELPPEVAVADGYHCLAEEIITAKQQCTLEGYDYQGQIIIYGVVDSLREQGGSSFSRYQYPSVLPEKLQRRMIAAARKVMAGIGLRNSPFNIEFFHDPHTDRLALLEINPRISKSHSPLFALVDGASHMEVMVDLALGRQPAFSQGQGRYPMAAKFMLRRFSDARVLRVPSADEIRRMKEEVPGTMAQTRVEPGHLLSALQDQDSYSYEYGVVFVGGENHQQLEEKYRRCLELLSFEFEAPS